MKIDLIKKLFTWIATLIGLIMMIIGSAGLINLGLRTFVFTKADQNCYYAPTPTKTDREDLICDSQNTSQRQRDAVNGISLLLVGLPVAVFFYKKT